MVDVLKLSNVFDVWQVYICVYLAFFLFLDQQQDEVLAFPHKLFTRSLCEFSSSGVRAADGSISRRLVVDRLSVRF